MRNVKCRNCYHYRRQWCVETIDSPHPDIERDCQYYREKTNADHIRSMTDEELAKFLAVFVQEREDEATYTQTWLGWLKQPYKEDGA